MISYRFSNISMNWAKEEVIGTLAYFSKTATDFVEYCKPLIPCVSRLRRAVFPGGEMWDEGFYRSMKEILYEALRT